MPALEPVFMNLRDLPRGRLETRPFGCVLWLLQRRQARTQVFREHLKRAVALLEAALLPRERHRWLELVSYIHALVYHYRSPAETPALQRTIETAVRAEKRKEISEMGKSYAQVLIERGWKEGELRARRDTLLRQLRRRFRRLPRRAARRVESTTDLQRLDDWLDRVLSARTLEEMEL